MRPNKGQVHRAGVHFVVAEVLRRGIEAVPARSRKVAGADITIAAQQGRPALRVKVKAKTNTMWQARIESKPVPQKRSETDFVALVSFEEGALPERSFVRVSDDIDEQFDVAGKRFGEALHKPWWRRRVDADGSVVESAKLDAIALAQDFAVPSALEDVARTTTQAWLRKWRTEIGGLPEGQRAAYAEVRSLASRSELNDQREPYPDLVQVTNADRRWSEHVYIDQGGLYPSKLNKWERTVIETELARKGEVVAWLRNLPRKPWSVTIPYWREGEEHPQYPDFLMLRRDATGGLVVDLLEPHMTDLADAAPKAFGLAKYADAHGDAFGRIEFIVIEGDDVLRLDLGNEKWREKVLVVAEGGDAAKLRLVLKEAAAAGGAAAT